MTIKTKSIFFFLLTARSRLRQIFHFVDFFFDFVEVKVNNSYRISVNQFTASACPTSALASNFPDMHVLRYILC